jgi:hypothetical protein
MPPTDASQFCSRASAPSRMQSLLGVVARMTLASASHAVASGPPPKVGQGTSNLPSAAGPSSRQDLPADFAGPRSSGFRHVRDVGRMVAIARLGV